MAIASIKPLWLGLYRTSRLVRNSGKFSKSGLSGNRTFSLLDSGLLKIEKQQALRAYCSDIYTVSKVEEKQLLKKLLLPPSP